MLEPTSEFKGENKRGLTKNVKFNLHLLAHKRSGFDSAVVLSNIPQWRTIVSVIKNGSSFVSLKKLERYLGQAKTILKMFILLVVYCIVKILQESSGKVLNCNHVY